MKRTQLAAMVIGLFFSLTLALPVRAQFIICGDGYCDSWFEDEDMCPQDCGPTSCARPCACPMYPGDYCITLCVDRICGDGQCVEGETRYSCPSDCPANYCCGNHHCDSSWGESRSTCPADCDTCGNAYCGTLEDLQTCPGDCWPTWDSDRDGLPNVYENLFTSAVPPLSAASAADAGADFDGDGASNLNEYWNFTDPWVADPVPAPDPLRLGCYYWGDGDGDGLPGPGDLSLMKTSVAGVTVNFNAVLPPAYDPLDLDNDGGPGPGDIALFQEMLVGTERPSGYPSMPAALSLVYKPSTGVAVGATTHVTVRVDSLAGTTPAAGFAVIFSVISGKATLLGGEGAPATPAGARYDVSMEGGLATVVVRMEGHTAVTIGVKVPACGEYPAGRWCDEIVLSPSIVINGQ